MTSTVHDPPARPFPPPPPPITINIPRPARLELEQLRQSLSRERGAHVTVGSAAVYAIKIALAARKKAQQ